MDKDNSIYQPELPFEENPVTQPPIVIAPGLPEFIAKNPGSVEARERGIKRAEFILGKGKDTQKLPTQRDTNLDNQTDTQAQEEFPPLDRESLENVAVNALFNQLIKDRVEASQTQESSKPKAVLGSKAKTNHSPLTREELDRGVQIKKAENYGNQGRSSASAAELKRADNTAVKNDKLS
jgi:hypothetical protein